MIFDLVVYVWIIEWKVEHQSRITFIVGLEKQVFHLSLPLSTFEYQIQINLDHIRPLRRVLLTAKERKAKSKA